MASISDDCLSSSDYVHVSANFSSHLEDNVSVHRDSASADQENLRHASPPLEESKDNVKKLIMSLNTDMKNSIGFDSADDSNATNNVASCSATSSPESFSIIDQSQTTPNASSKSPIMNPVVLQAIGNVGGRLASHPDTCTSSCSTLKIQSTELMEGSRESDVFRMSTTESNDSIIVLEEGDLKSFGQPSVTSDMSDSSQTHVMQVKSTTSENFSIVSAHSMTSPSSHGNKEADFEQSLCLESFDGFESLLNTKGEIKQEDSDDDLDLCSPSYPQTGINGQPLSSQPGAANKTSESYPNTNLLSSCKADDLKSFEVPRNSLEWWPEEGTGSKKPKSGSSTQSFESYQILSENVGTSLEIDSDMSMTTGVNSLSNLTNNSFSAELVQNSHSSEAHQSSPVQCASFHMQSFPVSKTSQSVPSLSHRDGDGNSSLPEDKDKVNSGELQSEQLVGTPSTVQQNADGDSDLFGTRDEISGEPVPEKWSFHAQQEETEYTSTQFIIMQTLKDFITAHGHIGHNNVENVSNLIANVLTDQNAQRKEIRKSDEMDSSEPLVEADQRPVDQMIVTDPSAEGGPEDFSMLSVSHPRMEDKMDDDFLDLVDHTQGEVAGECVVLSAEHSQIIPVSSVQLRLLCMMDGKSILKKKYQVTMEENVPDKAVILKGTIENINLAIKSIQNNEWLAEYCMKVTKLHPLLIDLLNQHTVVTLLDSEKLSMLGFRFCWLPSVETSCLVLYADTEQNAQAVLSTILQTAVLKTMARPKDMPLWKEKMNCLMQKNDGKILYCEEEDSIVIACCTDLTDEVNQCLQALEVKTKRKETEKFVPIDDDVFAYIKKWKMSEIEGMASAHQVGVADGLGATSGFIVMGTQENIQATAGLILDLVSQISSSRISIKSPEAAELFKMNDFALVKSQERLHHCSIKVEHVEMSPSSGERPMDISQGILEDVEFPVFRVNERVEIHIFCGQASQTDTDMLVEPAERLENTPYGKCRFLYIEKQKKKAAKVIVPAWNTESGKEKHELTDMLVEMFDDLKKHGVKSVAFPVRNFRNWPYGKLTKAIIVGLQTHIQKFGNRCDIQMVTLFDPEREVCSQICQVCRNAVGDRIKEMSIRPQRRSRHGLTVELVKGEIAKQTTDVIVNTTTKSLQLNSGKVSKSILETAGSEIQTQLNQYHPRGITPGEVAVTRGFKLDCKFVYHGALEPWPQLHAADSEKSRCLEMLEKFVEQCLSQAHQKGVFSMSFPALGCGTLNMPPAQVVRAMIKVFKQFEMAHPYSSVEEINIVIYPADEKIFKEFEKELKKYKQEKPKVPVRKQTHFSRQISLPAPRVSVSRQPSRTEVSCHVNGILLTAATGDITKQDKYDGLIRLFTNDPFPAGMGDDPVLKSISSGTTRLKETTVMSFSKNFVTPAGDLPQKKIVHVHASPHHLQRDILTALSTAENDGSFKSLVIPVRSNDPLWEDGRTFMSSVYQAVSEFTKLRNYQGRVREVGLCVTDPQILSTVLEELQRQSARGETDVKMAGLDEHRLLVLRVTSMNSKMEEIISQIRSIESTPEKYVEQAMEGEGEIPSVAQDVYEAFLYFYSKDLQTQLTSVNMRYDGRGSKIILAGPCENLRGSEALVKQMLRELTDRMHVDTIPLPNLENSVLQSMVREIQPLFKEALLFVPLADHFNGIHVIALSSEEAQRVKKLTMEKISYNSDSPQQKMTLSASRQNPIPDSSQQRMTLSANSRQTPIPIDFRSNIHTFITEENIQVFIYKEDILNLPVSCIVNAANEYLQHGSGVALAILQAAGESFDNACKEHIKRKGLVKVGTCAETEAGNLPYACVINAVGPRWDSSKESLCKTQLHSAVESSIVKAAQLGMSSVGIPAISSGIFGMPVDICAYQYAYAVISASSKIKGSSLKEVHFIDVDDAVVVVMKQIFSSIFSGNTDSVPRLSLSINSASVNPIVHPPATGSLGLDGRVSPDFPKSCTYEKGGVVFHEYHLTDGFSVQVYTGNIVKSATNVIVCAEDKDLKHEGDVSKAIFDLGGKEVQFNVEECKGHNPKPGDVYVVDAGRNFDETVYIFMAISPVYAEADSEENWLECVNTCHTNVLHMASQRQVYNIAMPLIGTTENSPHVPIVSSCMVKQITDFVNNRPSGCQLNSIHIVNIRDETTLAITRSLDDYVTEERTKLQSMMMKIGNCNIGENVQEIPMDVEECNAGQLNYQNIPCGSQSNQMTSKQTAATAADVDDHHCVICLEMVKEDCETLPKCRHRFCKPCIDRQFKFKPVCPTCGEVYGVVYGTQPPGTMTVHTSDQCIPGFSKCKTHVITYDFKEGIQGEEHPNPGVGYRGEHRVAYLPDSPKGQLALKLLKLAFDRRLVFTIGYSRTTGRDNVITWNDIHHKTSMRGGPERFGYPDPQYLDRLLEELATKGVSEKDLN